MAVVSLFPLSAQAQNTSGTISRSNTTNSNNRNNRTGNVFLDNGQSPDTSQSQDPQGIKYESGEVPDSVLQFKVFCFPPTLRDCKIYEIEHPSLLPDGIELFNPVHRMDGDYHIDLGALGQSHLTLFPYGEETHQLLTQHGNFNPLPQTLQSDAFPVYRQQLHYMRHYQTMVPYTMLQYGSSINKDYSISIIHSQNIKPRWNIAFHYDLTSREGEYTNSGVTNHLLDLTTNYYSEDARYQMQAGVTFNILRQEENGGVLNDTTCWESSRREGVPVIMYAAQNGWHDLEVNIHQTYNTVRQFYKTHPIIQEDSTVLYDTVYPHSPRTLNSGVIGLDIHFGRHKRLFNDVQPTSWFYNGATLDTTYYFDSTTHYKATADLYWTNDAYMHHKWSNPLVLQLGVRPEYNRIQYAVGQRDLMNVNPFAKATIQIGTMSLEAGGERMMGDECDGDYRVHTRMQFNVGRHGCFNAALLSEALSPDMIYYHNEGLYSWDNTHFELTKRQQISAGFNFNSPDSVKGPLNSFETRCSFSRLSNAIWLNSNMLPTQGNESGWLSQGILSTHLQFGWFHVKMQEILQYSTDNNVVRVPIFASKNSMYADIHIFNRALQMQTGIDLRYHTKYFADGWNPILGTYYRQDEVEVGNYIVADIWISLQIKKASIYLKASHFNASIEDLMNIEHSYFSLPHYPMEDLGVYWGVIWKFFN